MSHSPGERASWVLFTHTWPFLLVPETQPFPEYCISVCASCVAFAREVEDLSRRKGILDIGADILLDIHLGSEAVTIHHQLALPEVDTM